MKRKRKLLSAILAVCIIVTGSLGVSLTSFAQLDVNGENNLIQDPCFTEGGASSWKEMVWGGAISSQTGDTPIFDDVTTYGAITNRESEYECFAQDITAKVKNNTEYVFSFWAKLSDDYAGAPEERRWVVFAPVVTSKVNGSENTDYMGSYSEGMSGNSAVLEPGVWTQISGTFKVSYEGELVQVLARFMEQGSETGDSAGLKGDYYVTGVVIQEKSTVSEEELPNASGTGAEISEDGNLIQDFRFSEAGAPAWRTGVWGATVSSQTSDTPIFDDVTTYGAITSRTSSYESFAQDITALVKNNTEYVFSFWAKLSDDYAGAPEERRWVVFAPYVTTNVNGSETTDYMGSYSEGMTGNGAVLEPGVWTQISGSFKLSYEGELVQVVARFMEQGSETGDDDAGLKGDYYVTDVVIREKSFANNNVNVDPDLIETDIPALKDVMSEELGAIVGTSLTASELNDENLWTLLTTHFNAVTIGNELKPDALFGYSNGRCPGTTEASLDGETLVVPNLDYSRAENVLNKIKAWNDANPDSKIMVKGHVLVWHSQTPEWFFHVDYDKNKDYVDKETMDKRLKWYIKTVLEHFTGEGSAYEGMFYGWDVVNEAVSDSGGYRTDTENSDEALSKDTHGSNSSWWHVYQSNEYIINAFKYANEFAPASVELYYNDYNECSTKKRTSIVELLTAVKEQEGAPGEGTRIDGMGMQAHYSLTNPAILDFQSTVDSYSEVVGNVHLTEFDMKASDAYDGTDATREKEYSDQAERYKLLYEVMVSRKDVVGGVTFWGVVDKYSWLQSSSEVGGGSTESRVQCPLLFDDNYQAKPAFWAFADSSGLASDGSQIADADEADGDNASGSAGEDQGSQAEGVDQSGDEEPQSNSGLLIGGIVAIVICVCIVAAVIVYRKKLKK